MDEESVVVPQIQVNFEFDGDPSLHRAIVDEIRMISGLPIILIYLALRKFVVSDDNLRKTGAMSAYSPFLMNQKLESHTEKNTIINKYCTFR